MRQPQIEMEGTIREDGTLELDLKVNLPPGRVKVTVKPVAQQPPGEDLMTVLQRIWAEQDAHGYVPRTREEIDAQVQAFRDEFEEYFRAIEQSHLDNKKAREGRKPDQEHKE
jgi:hypothetical protein